MASTYSRYWEPYLTISIIYWVLTLGLAACGGGGGGTKAAPGQWASMANPASKYCAELGGRLEIRAEQAARAEAERRAAEQQLPAQPDEGFRVDPSEGVVREPLPPISRDSLNFDALPGVN